MNSSADHSRSTRSCDTVELTSGLCMTGTVEATDYHQRNYRHGCHFKHNMCDILQNVRRTHQEAAVRATGHVQAPSQRLVQVHSKCSCCGELPEPLQDHDHQNVDEKTYWRRVSGCANVNSMQTGHVHNVCDRGCCSPAVIPLGIGSLADGAIDRIRTTGRTSLFPVSADFQRNTVDGGFMSHLPSMPRDLEMRSASPDTSSMANSLFSTQTAKVVPRKQIMLYGWFLVKPVNDNFNTGSPANSGVSIGGYTCPRMADADFFGTAPVVQRLERWKLRTCDGLEVGLIGMINVEKSVASGFSPALVNCFMIGFPSAWIYMILNMSSGSSKGGSPVMNSPVPLEADPIHSILKSSLFTAAEEDVQALRACQNSSKMQNATEASDCPVPGPQGVEVKTAEDPESSSQTENPTKSRDCSLTGPKVVEEEDADIPESSSQTDNPMRSRNSPLVGRKCVVAEDGEGHESSSHTKDAPDSGFSPSFGLKDVEAEDAQVHESSSQTQTAMETVDCLASLTKATELEDAEVPEISSQNPTMSTDFLPSCSKGGELEDADEVPENSSQMQNPLKCMDGPLPGMNNVEVEKEVDKSCKAAARSKGPAHKKRHRVSRNYYSTKKRKSSVKGCIQGKEVQESVELVTSHDSPLEEGKGESDESQVEDEKVESEVNKKAERSSRSGARKAFMVKGGIAKALPKRDRQAKNSIVPPPLPPPRIADKSKVTEAFGLKRSLRGRVLVPPLATWRSQSIKYDRDGGIIAISDGFMGPEADSSSGYYNFKPPSNKGAKKMQRRLCKAAEKNLRM